MISPIVRQQPMQYSVAGLIVQTRLQGDSIGNVRLRFARSGGWRRTVLFSMLRPSLAARSPRRTTEKVPVADRVMHRLPHQCRATHRCTGALHRNHGPEGLASL